MGNARACDDHGCAAQGHFQGAGAWHLARLHRGFPEQQEEENIVGVILIRSLSRIAHVSLLSVSITLCPLRQAPGHGAQVQEELPPQLFFVHQGQKNIKEIHWHKQIPNCVLSTAEDGFNVFKVRTQKTTHRTATRAPCLRLPAPRSCHGTRGRGLLCRGTALTNRPES
jgi:hypothetical protein